MQANGWVMSSESDLPTESLALSIHYHNLSATVQSSVTPIVMDVEALNELDTPLVPYDMHEQGQHEADSESASH